MKWYGSGPFHCFYTPKDGLDKLLSKQLNPFGSRRGRTAQKKICRALFRKAGDSILECLSFLIGPKSNSFSLSIPINQPHLERRNQPRKKPFLKMTEVQAGLGAGVKKPRLIRV
jgi:hypothetical protein